jgi:hypothetical protein
VTDLPIRKDFEAVAALVVRREIAGVGPHLIERDGARLAALRDGPASSSSP